MVVCSRGGTPPAKRAGLVSPEIGPRRVSAAGVPRLHECDGDVAVADAPLARELKSLSSEARRVLSSAACSTRATSPKIPRSTSWCGSTCRASSPAHSRRPGSRCRRSSSRRGGSTFLVDLRARVSDAVNARSAASRRSCASPGRCARGRVAVAALGSWPRETSPALHQAAPSTCHRALACLPPAWLSQIKPCRAPDGVARPGRGQQRGPRGSSSALPGGLIRRSI